MPSIDPENAAAPLRVSPATRYMIAPVSSATAANAVQLAGHPRRASGITPFQTTRQLKAKLKIAFNPVHPPNAHSNTQNPANSASDQPLRQWSRATSGSPPSATADSGTATTATSPGAKCLSRSSCARISLYAVNFRPSAGGSSTSTSSRWVP